MFQSLEFSFCLQFDKEFEHKYYLSHGHLLGFVCVVIFALVFENTGSLMGLFVTATDYDKLVAFPRRIRHESMYRRFDWSLVHLHLRVLIFHKCMSNNYVYGFCFVYTKLSLI